MCRVTQMSLYAQLALCELHKWHCMHIWHCGITRQLSQTHQCQLCNVAYLALWYYQSVIADSPMPILQHCIFGIEYNANYASALSAGSHTFDCIFGIGYNANYAIALLSLIHI